MKELFSHMNAPGFQQLDIDKLMVTQEPTEGVKIVEITMGDFLGTTTNSQLIKYFYKLLKKKYKTKRLGWTT